MDIFVTESPIYSLSRIYRFFLPYLTSIYMYIYIYIKYTNVVRPS